MPIQAWGRAYVVSAGGAAVALDAAGTFVKSGTGITTFDYTGITTNSVTKAAIVVACAFDRNFNPTGISVTWDPGGANQAFSLIGQADVAGADLVQLWGLVAPNSVGNKTIRISWTNTTQLFVGATSWQNVNQSGGTTSFPNFNSATGVGSNPSVSITSATTHAVVGIVGDNGSGTLSAMNGTTLSALQSGGNISSGANYIVPGSASQTVSATDTSGNCSIAGCDIST